MKHPAQFSGDAGERVNDWVSCLLILSGLLRGIRIYRYLNNVENSSTLMFTDCFAIWSILLFCCRFDMVAPISSATLCNSAYFQHRLSISYFLTWQSNFQGLLWCWTLHSSSSQGVLLSSHQHKGSWKHKVQPFVLVKHFTHLLNVGRNPTWTTGVKKITFHTFAKWWISFSI